MTTTELAPFDVPAFLAELRAVGCSLGEPFHYLTTTTSTNDAAKDLAATGAPNGTTCFADFQTSGRGRQGKTWSAQPNAQILTSVLLKSSRGANNAAVTLAVGVALHRALCALLPQEPSLRIKWPNDVEARGRKLAGILTESTASRGSAVTVVGIGLNVSELPSALPGETQAIALRTLGLDMSRESVMVRVLQSLAEAVATFERDDLAPFVPYLNQYDALVGTTISVDGLDGQAAGIAPDGSLRLATANGVVAVSSGTIERR